MTSPEEHELDSACRRGEPAGERRSPSDVERNPAEWVRQPEGWSWRYARSNNRFSFGTTRGGWSRNGRKTRSLKQRDLPGVRLQPGRSQRSHTSFEVG